MSPLSNNPKSSFNLIFQFQNPPIRFSLWLILRSDHLNQTRFKNLDANRTEKSLTLTMNRYFISNNWTSINQFADSENDLNKLYPHWIFFGSFGSPKLGLGLTDIFREKFQAYFLYLVWLIAFRKTSAQARSRQVNLDSLLNRDHFDRFQRHHNSSIGLLL